LYVFLSVRTEQLDSPIGRIFMKFDFHFLKIFRENSYLIKIPQEKWVLPMNTKCIFMEVFHLIFLRMRNFSYKSCRENQNTHFGCSNFFFFFFENRAVYEIMWGKYCRAGQATNSSRISYIRFPCYIPKPMGTH
jgi:hypothetical protein